MECRLEALGALVPAGGVMGQGHFRVLKQHAPASRVARGEHKERRKAEVGGRGEKGGLSPEEEAQKALYGEPRSLDIIWQAIGNLWRGVR